MDKVCKSCGVTKPIDQFHKHCRFKDGLYLYCKDCTNEKNRISWHKYKDIRKKSHKNWEISNKKHLSKYRSKQYRELKDKVIDHYGGKCVICGFDNKLALCIDHVNGNGLKERKRIKAIGFVREIIKQGYPDKYQILCANCNQIKAIEKGEIPVNEIYRR